MPDERSTDTAATPRVKVVHAQTRRTLALAAAFAVAAPAAVFAPHKTGAWLPLHLFLVGAVLLAISGASRMFTVTWAAGEPVTGAPVAAQRWLIAGGAAGLAIGRELDWPSFALAAAGMAVMSGLVLLGALLVAEARTAKVRRFHPAVAAYLVAVGFGVVGTGLGAAMVSGRAGLRDSHVIVNLLGLVGLVIAGTLPFFAATQTRMKMNGRATPRRLHANLIWLTTSVAVASVAAAAKSHAVEGAALAAYAAGLAQLATLLPRPARKQLRWAGPRLLLLAAGVMWWASSVGVAAGHALAGSPVFTEQLVVTVVIGGYAQILLASLAYLGPVLRGGGHERLSAGFALTRSWVAPVAANVAALAWIGGAATVTGVALAVLAVDLAGRAAALVTGGDGRRHPSQPAPKAAAHV